MKTSIKKLANTFVFVVLLFNVKTSFAQTAANVNQFGLAFNAPDAFNFKGNTVAFYGLGWYNELPNTPPIAYFSGYSGIRFFAEGQPRMLLDMGGNLSLGTSNPLSRLHIAGGDESITLGEYNNSNNTKGIYFPGFRDIMPNYFGASIESVPDWICCGGFPAATGYPGIRNMGLNFNVHGNVDVADSKLTAMAINSNGNIGIGTLNPDQKLTIKGGGIGFDHNSADKKLYSPQDGELEWMTNQGAVHHGFAVSHQGERRVYLNVLGDSYINGGNLGIGTISPKEKLSVNGNIRAKEIKVEATNWPDYVFKEGYNVGTLKELESYIKANKHLPEMPTVTQVEKDGVLLGEMNKLLLKKIEELTLHLIDKEHEIQEIKASQLASQKKAEEDLAAVLKRLSVLEKSK